MKITSDSWNKLKGDLNDNKFVAWWKGIEIIEETNNFIILFRPMIFFGSYHIYPKSNDINFKKLDLQKRGRRTSRRLLDLGGTGYGEPYPKPSNLIYDLKNYERYTLSEGLSLEHKPKFTINDRNIKGFFLKEEI